MTGLLLVFLTQAPNPYLEQGKALARALKFDEAVEQLKVARQVPGMQKPEKLEVLELLGRCEIAQGHRDEADAAYTELLGVEPSYELDDKAAPKMRELFGAVKRRLYPEPWLKLLPLPAGPGEALVKIVDPYHRLVTLAFTYRRDGGAWDTKPLPTPADAMARLPLDVEPGHSLDWYLQAQDANGTALASWGTADQPQHLTVTATDNGPVLVSESTPRLKRAPAWVAVAVAVVAAGAGATLQAISVDEAHKAHDRTQAPGNFPDTARAAEGRSVTDATVATGLFIGAGVAAGAGVVMFAW